MIFLYRRRDYDSYITPLSISLISKLLADVQMRHIQYQAHVFIRNGIHLIFSVPRHLNKIRSPQNRQLVRYRRLAHPHVLADVLNAFARLKKRKQDLQSRFIRKHFEESRHGRKLCPLGHPRTPSVILTHDDASSISCEHLVI